MNEDEEVVVALTRDVYEYTRTTLQDQEPDVALIVLTLSTQMLLSAAADAYEVNPNELIDEFCAKLKNIAERYN